MAPSTRRDFLRQLIVRQTPVVDDPGANVLVCVFLRGGADTLSMVVPCGDDRYYAKRPTLSVPHAIKGSDDASIRLDDFYAFHPKMSPQHPAWIEGCIGIVQAVGSDNPSGS